MQGETDLVPEGTSNQPWFVVRTQPRRERFAAENVARAGYVVYSPEFMETVRATNFGRRRREFQVRPLFPSYIFAQHADNQWHELLRTFGVSGIVPGTGGQPALLRDRDVLSIRALEQNGIVILPDGSQLPDAPLRLNEPVRVTSGAYAGYNGLVNSSPSNERVKILLDYMGRKVPFLVRVESLERITGGPLLNAAAC